MTLDAGPRTGPAPSTVLLDQVSWPGLSRTFAVELQHFESQDYP